MSNIFAFTLSNEIMSQVFFSFAGQKNLSFLSVIRVALSRDWASRMKGERGRLSFVLPWNARGASRMLQFSGVLSAALDNTGRPIHVSTGREYCYISLYFSLLQGDFAKSFVTRQRRGKNCYRSTAIGVLRKNEREWFRVEKKEEQTRNCALFSFYRNFSHRNCEPRATPSCLSTRSDDGENPPATIM